MEGKTMTDVMNGMMTATAKPAKRARPIESTISNPTVKECKRCKQTKSIVEFYKDKSSSDGHGNPCLFCRTGKTRAEMDAKMKDIVEKRAKREWVRRTLWPKQKWTCQVCNQEKWWTDFNPDGRHPNQPSWCCKVCEHTPAAGDMRWQRSHDYCVRYLG
jgi:hypothetical protein